MLRSAGWGHVWSALRIAMAAVIVAAIAAQLARSVGRAVADGSDVTTVVANFFSFFTILSNAGAAAVLAWAAIWWWMRRARQPEEPRALAVALASVTTYMLVTGLVYNTLLRGIELPQASTPIPWSNETLHVIAPAFLLLDLFLAPRRRRLAWSTAGWVLVFPIVWVAYTLIRGPLVTNPVRGTPYWYPYPFLDPHTFDNGHLGVAVYVVGIAALIVGVAFFVVWIGRRRGAPPGQAHETAHAVTSPSASAQDTSPG